MAEKKSIYSLEQSSSAPLGLNSREDILNFVSHSVENTRRWMASNEFNLAKSYEELKVHICFTLRIAGGLGEQNFIFRAIPLGRQECELPTMLEFSGDSSARGNDCGGDNQSVLVGITELVQTPEKIIRSEVWLERFHDCKNCIGNISGTSGLATFHLGRSVPEGEMSIPSLAAGSDVTGLVKGSSHIKNRIRGDAVEHDWKALGELDLMKILSGIRITFSDLTVWVTCEEGISLPGEINNVVLCSCEHVPRTF